ncbi:MAG: TraR/DksA family transcriptional regulator [Acidimicrobiales bacterium]
MPNESTTAVLRAKLEQEREDLRGRLTELGFGESGGLEYDQNFADSSQVTAERGEAEALATTLKEQIEEVEIALHRIDEGKYGICDTCGEAINEARLEAMPAAHQCVDCASKR